MIRLFRNAVRKFPQLVPLFEQLGISSSNFESVEVKRLSLSGRPYAKVAKPHQFAWVQIWLIIQKGKRPVARHVTKTRNGWITPETILEEMPNMTIRPVKNIVVVEKLGNSYAFTLLTMDRRSSIATLEEYMGYIVDERATARKK